MLNDDMRHVYVMIRYRLYHIQYNNLIEHIFYRRYRLTSALLRNPIARTLELLSFTLNLVISSGGASCRQAKPCECVG